MRIIPEHSEENIEEISEGFIAEFYKEYLEYVLKKFQESIHKQIVGKN